MKSFKKFLIPFFLIVTLSFTASAQNFRSELRKLESTVTVAYKSKKLTANEYAKLKREQEIIRATIEKSEADGIVTPDEKNKIHSKLVRSRKRLAKYKTNREIY